MLLKYQYPIKALSILTGYFPSDKGIEGGYVDQQDRPLVGHTLQDFLSGVSSYVAVAMDNDIAYGTPITCQWLDDHFGKHINLIKVDTGGKFNKSGVADLTRADVCCSTEDNTFAFDPKDPPRELIIFVDETFDVTK
jgi:hypothetical protein